MGRKLKLIGFLLFFSIAVSTTVFCQHLAYAQEENVKVQAGESAPSFSVNTLEGQTVTLDDYQGRVLILEFFASWCHVCKNATPELRSVKENFSSENLALLSVESSPGVPIENVRDFKSKYGGDWAFAKAPSVADRYGVEGYPTIFVVAPDGYITFTTEGAPPVEVLNEAVSNALNPSGPENKAPSNVIINVSVEPENAGGIVATSLRIKKNGAALFTYEVKANPGYEFVGWSGDAVPENQGDSPILKVSPTVGTEVTANFSPVGGERGQAPTASFTHNSPVSTNETLNVDASGSSDSDGSIDTYAWDWTNDGSYEVTGSTSTTNSYSYSDEGTYTIKLRVTDDDEATDTHLETVTVQNRAPSASGSLDPIFFILGAASAGCLGVLSGYLAWGREGMKSEED